MLVFWNNYSGIELDDIENEFGSFCGEKGFKYYYKKYIQKSPYSFLYMNFVKGLVMKNFEKILYRVEKNNNSDSESDEEEKTEVI